MYYWTDILASLQFSFLYSLNCEPPHHRMLNMQKCFVVFLKPVMLTNFLVRIDSFTSWFNQVLLCFCPNTWEEDEMAVTLNNHVPE